VIDEELGNASSRDAREGGDAVSRRGHRRGHSASR
jgi:hypothetical protein